MEKPGDGIVPTLTPQVGEWIPGDLVERLLDDVSDIWTGAVVREARLEVGLYDIEFCDDHRLEHGVEACELRGRKMSGDFPEELWQRTGQYLSNKRDLCALEMLARTSHAVAKRELQTWWCSAYHYSFNRCSAKCNFKTVFNSAGVFAAAQELLRCRSEASASNSPLARLSWKERYIEHESLSKAKDKVFEADATNAACLDYRYGISGKKAASDLDGRIRYGRNARRGFYFDPRLGRMVTEDG